MLNRHSLRIKTMQSLFALHQCKEANHGLCLTLITQRFAPDLNSMEVQNKELLKEQRQIAYKVFEKAFTSESGQVEHEEPKIEKVVNEALEYYAKQTKRDVENQRKNLVQDAERIYDYYISVLSLGVAIAEAAATDKKLTHTGFLNNLWIKGLQNSESLKKDSLKLNRHWNDKMDRVRVWFRDVIRTDDTYLESLDRKTPTLEEQRKVVSHIFKKLVLGKTIINDFFEEEVLHWAEDKEIVKGMVEKTIKTYDPKKSDQLGLMTLSLDWNDDKAFVEKLYNYASDLPEDQSKLISDNTRNWEVDRLPLTDRVILEMAIAELITFPGIPVKVTINEYIELAKGYSTPKSRQFVNGILDVIAKTLQDNGTLKKSGRGLIDNK
ncbi:MAG: transcription antitermination factor NusB [Cytophagia bacterium]|nr:transcription antitermination factor NusB [Cytophagia bacterium]